MNKTIDYFIDSETDPARFEYYFEEELSIKSVTLKSIIFYVAYVDLKKGILYKEDVLFLTMDHHSEIRKEINLKILRDFLNDWGIADHVKFHSDKYHLIIELLEDKIFTLPDSLPDIFPDFIMVPDHVDRDPYCVCSWCPCVRLSVCLCICHFVCHAFFSLPVTVRELETGPTPLFVDPGI